MRSTTLALVTLSVLFLNMHYAVSQSPPKREFRGVWLTTVGNGDWPTAPGLPVETQKSQLVTYLDQLRAEGINVVFLQIRPECDAFYNSALEPWSYWLTGVQGTSPVPFYDPLEFATNEVHKRGMELHAWFNPYRAVRSGSNYPKATNHITVTRPEWVMTVGTTKILDPGKSVVRKYVLDVIGDVVRRYDIDGVVMDDYFYVEGISKQDSATFANESRGITNLGDWRRDNVNLLIRAIYDTINSVKPYVKFGMSPRGIWKNGVPPGIIGNDNYNTIYCDAVAWLTGGYIDYFSPQLYWKFGGGQDYGLLEPWWATQLNGRIYCPSLAAYRINEVNFGTSGEIARQIRFNRNSGNTHGQVPFTANNLTGNLGGIGDTLKRDLYRTPALLPSFPWEDNVPPYPPRAIQYARLPGGGPWAVQWQLPLTAPDGDTASRYAVYRFDHRPTIAEFSDARNLVSVEGRRWLVPPIPQVTGLPVYFAVTALDRNFNESDTSNILVVEVPSTPMLASPVNGATSLPESVLVRWRPTVQTVQYHLQVSTDPSFTGSLLVNDSTIADTSRIVKELTGLVTYSWRVRSGNAAGFGSFAIAYSFSTGFPPAPNLVAPPHQTTDVPVTPTFRWNAASAAASYRIQISKGADFATIFADSSGLTDTTAAVGPLEYYRIYFWRVRVTNGIGTSGWSSVNSFRTAQLVAVERENGVPKEYALSQNYPNPFNPSTTIQFALPKSGRVSVKVYDVLGREEATLVDDEMPPGSYRVTWNAANAASGVYFYRIVAGSFAATKRMVLVR